MRRSLLIAAALGLGCGAPQPEPELIAHRAPAEEAGTPATNTPPPRFDIPPPPSPEALPSRVSLPLPGTVLAHGGGPLRADVVDRFARLCGKTGRLVLIPTASEGADNPATLQSLPTRWRKRVGNVEVLHTLDPERANDLDFVRPLLEADCVWFGGGAQGRLRDAYVDTKVHEALHAVLRRGGVIGGYSAGAAILSSVIIRRGNPEPVEDVGFGVLPEVIVDQHFVVEHREPRLRTMLERYPDRVGFGIDEQAALLVHGTDYEVIGQGIIRRCTHAGGCVTLEPGARGRYP